MGQDYYSRDTSCARHGCWFELSLSHRLSLLLIHSLSPRPRRSQHSAVSSAPGRFAPSGMIIGQIGAHGLARWARSAHVREVRQPWKGLMSKSNNAQNYIRLWPARNASHTNDAAAPISLANDRCHTESHWQNSFGCRLERSNQDWHTGQGELQRGRRGEGESGKPGETVVCSRTGMQC